MEVHRAFKGVWIPKELWLNKDLSIIEKCLLVEIDSLDKGEGCFAGNDYLSKFIGVSEGRCANMVSGLRKRGFVETVKSDGRKRWIRVKADFTKTLRQTSQKREHSNTVREEYVETEKVPTTNPDKVRLLTLTKDNEKLMRHLPKTVRNKPVTFREAGGVLAIMTIYNEVRSLYKNKESSVSPNLKGCIQAVELIRDDVDLHNIDETFHNMFGADYHKENNWIHLTPEFVTRTDKFQKYE